MFPVHRLLIYGLSITITKVKSTLTSQLVWLYFQHSTCTKTISERTYSSQLKCECYLFLKTSSLLKRHQKVVYH